MQLQRGRGHIRCGGECPSQCGNSLALLAQGGGQVFGMAGQGIRFGHEGIELIRRNQPGRFLKLGNLFARGENGLAIALDGFAGTQFTPVKFVGPQGLNFGEECRK